MIGFLFKLQNNGDRIYLHCNILIRKYVTGMLQRWNNDYPYNSILYGSKFVGVLLKEVFGKLTLNQSSLYRNKSSNGEKLHKALQPDKIRFIKFVVILIFFYIFQKHIKRTTYLLYFNLSRHILQQNSKRWNTRKTI